MKIDAARHVTITAALFLAAACAPLQKLDPQKQASPSVLVTVPPNCTTTLSVCRLMSSTLGSWLKSLQPTCDDRAEQPRLM